MIIVLIASNAASASVFPGAWTQLDCDCPELCGEGGSGSGSGPGSGFGTPTLRAVNCTLCDSMAPPPYDCLSTGPIEVPEVWRLQFRTVRHHPNACGCDMPGEDPRLIDVYLALTGLSSSGYLDCVEEGLCPSWKSCYVQLCPACAGWCYTSGGIIDPDAQPPAAPTGNPDGMEMFIMNYCGTPYEISNAFAPCDDGSIGGSVYTVTEPMVAIRLWVIDAIEDARWVTPLAGFNWNGPNTFDLVIDCTISDCCLGVGDPILSLPASLTIYPSATPACLVDYIA